MKAEKQPPNMEMADVLRAGTARDLPVRIIPGLPAQLRKLMCPGFASHPPGAQILYSVPSVGPQTTGRENDVCEEVAEEHTALGERGGNALSFLYSGS